ncbi:LysR substrate-binding domain-containing protein [Acinetobacter baumannii]|nr:LysR substrate-binding domain-containing protein [Acinetobacter baumannii]
MRFEGLDLNLLVALDVLLTEKNITRASEKLLLSQSATSAALARLRSYFDDELLVQVGRNMVPTPMGESLFIPVNDLLMQARTVLDNNKKFQPMLSRRKFRIMASDYVASILLPKLNQKLYTLAPYCSIEQFMPYSEAGKQIQRGKVDILLLPERHVLLEHPSQALFEDDFICVMWNGNPLKEKSLTLEDFKNAEHVLTRFGVDNTPMMDDWLVKNLDFKRKEAYITTNFYSVPQFLVNTPYIAIMHKRLALQCATCLPLHLCALPWDVPKLTVCMQWNKFQENDSSLQWIRKLLIEVASELVV